MQNIFREYAWRMLCSIEIILNKIHETLFFHQSATYLGHWSWPSRHVYLKSLGSDKFSDIWLDMESILEKNTDDVKFCEPTR